MAKQRRDIWRCDAPGCSVEIPDEGEPPEGFSGKVSTAGGSGVTNEPWFACRREHIESAIMDVTESAHQRVWGYS